MGDIFTPFLQFVFVQRGWTTLDIRTIVLIINIASLCYSLIFYQNNLMSNTRLILSFLSSKVIFLVVAISTMQLLGCSYISIFRDIVTMSFPGILKLLLWIITQSTI